MVDPLYVSARGARLAIAVVLLVSTMPSRSSNSFASGDGSQDPSDEMDGVARDESYDHESSDSNSDSNGYGASIETRAQCQGYTCGFRSSCGQAPMNGIARTRSSFEPYIVNGEDQIYGEWPSFVALIVMEIGKLDKRLRGVGGGVLISDRHILTAAHNVDHKLFGKPKLIHAAFGVHNTSELVHRKPLRPTEISSIYVSKGHRSKDWLRIDSQDWAVIELRDRVNFTDYIQPACLPYGYTKGKKYRNCHLVGNGATSTRKADGSFDHKWIVQKMAVRPVACKRGSIDDAETEVCYRKGGSIGSSCYGDSGSPILCIDPTTERWTVVATATRAGDLDCRARREFMLELQLCCLLSRSKPGSSQCKRLFAYSFQPKIGYFWTAKLTSISCALSRLLD